MRMKSVSSLILLMGTLGYAAMLIGMNGPGAAVNRNDHLATPARTQKKDLPPRRDRTPVRPSLIYFAANIPQF